MSKVDLAVLELLDDLLNKGCIDKFKISKARNNPYGNSEALIKYVTDESDLNSICLRYGPTDESFCDLDIYKTDYNDKICLWPIGEHHRFSSLKATAMFIVNYFFSEGEHHV